MSIFSWTYSDEKMILMGIGLSRDTTTTDSANRLNSWFRDSVRTAGQFLRPYAHLISFLELLA